MIKALNDSLTIANELRPVLLRLGRHLRREIHSLGVTGGQVSLLVAIKTRPGITQRELADQERVSAAGMSGQLVRLEHEGLIRRERAQDRRRIGLFLTEDGDRVLRSVRNRRTTWLADRLDKLTERERAAVEAALPALAKLLGEEER